MEIKRIEEFQIDESTAKSIKELLRKCFPEYPWQRIYYKQIPSFRYLVFEGDILIGHMGVEHRMMNIGAQAASVFGVVDICISPDFQHRKVASSLLQELETLGRQHQIDFIVLIAQNHQLYKTNGFQLHNNTCRWLMINEHQTLGVNHRHIDDCLMVKALGEKTWNQGLVDFLGYVF